MIAVFVLDNLTKYGSYVYKYTNFLILTNVFNNHSNGRHLCVIKQLYSKMGKEITPLCHQFRAKYSKIQFRLHPFVLLLQADKDFYCRVIK